MKNSRSAHSLRAAVSVSLLSLGAAAGACGGDKLGPSVPASVAAVSGDSQSVLAGNRASAPLVVVVKNSSGSPLPNVEVRWAVAASDGGSLQAVVDTTDANGQASNVYFSPALAGTAKVNAVAASQGHVFTVTIVADTAGHLVAYGGDGAAALVGTPLTLTAKATDRFGNAMSGVAVSWSTSGGSLQTASNATDSTGVATNVVTVGSSPGPVTITATSRFNAVTFTVTALQPPPP